MTRWIGVLPLFGLVWVTAAVAQTGAFSATVTADLTQGEAFDPLDIYGSSLSLGTAISGSFTVAETGYADTLTTATQIYAFSDGNPGLISVNVNVGGQIFSQSDASFNQITYTAAAAGQAYTSQGLSANNYGPSGATTQILLSLTPQSGLAGSTLQDLLNTAFTAQGGALEFYEFDDGTLIGGFYATITTASYSIPEPAGWAVLAPLLAAGMAMRKRVLASARGTPGTKRLLRTKAPMFQTAPS